MVKMGFLSAGAKIYNSAVWGESVTSSHCTCVCEGDITLPNEGSFFPISTMHNFCNFMDFMLLVCRISVTRGCWFKKCS